MGPPLVLECVDEFHWEMLGDDETNIYRSEERVRMYRVHCHAHTRDSVGHYQRSSIV